MSPDPAASAADQACESQRKALVTLFEQNVERRWKPLSEQLSSPTIPEAQRPLCSELVTAGMHVAVNVLQALHAPEAGVLRQFVSALDQERKAIAEWKRKAKEASGGRPTAPLTTCLAYYEEQILELRALQALAECLEARSSEPEPVWAWNAKKEVPQGEPARIKKPKHIVLLVHGILTEANWQERVAKQIRQCGIEVYPLKYGYFDVISFLLPGWTRLAPIKRVHKELRDVQWRHRDAQVSVVAHSFGTYAICSILEDFSDLRLDRLILCGSVVREGYPWDRVSEQVNHRIVNECGARDIWPRMASTCSWGYGASGARGFGTARVRDRFHPGKHSDFFETGFVELYWLPFILYGEVVESDYEHRRPKAPFGYGLLSFLPLRWVLAGLALGGTWWGLHGMYSLGYL
jgi:pimeloyl-ACP methyl ester carboxylesterase